MCVHVCDLVGNGKYFLLQIGAKKKKKCSQYIKEGKEVHPSFYGLNLFRYP